MDMPPKQCANLGKALHHVEQGVWIAQPDRVHPGAIDRDRLMMETDQMMALWRLAHRLSQQLQLIIGQVARDRTRHGRIKQGDAPVAYIHDRLKKIASCRTFGHLRALIMVAAKPARGCGNLCRQLPKASIGFHGSVLRQVARC
ncbi:hypothetical protein D9M73_237520 [compost metagenome]